MIVEVIFLNTFALPTWIQLNDTIFLSKCIFYVVFCSLYSVCTCASWNIKLNLFFVQVWITCVVKKKKSLVAHLLVFAPPVSIPDSTNMYGSDQTSCIFSRRWRRIRYRLSRLYLFYKVSIRWLSKATYWESWDTSGSLEVGRNAGLVRPRPLDMVWDMLWRVGLHVLLVPPFCLLT